MTIDDVRALYRSYTVRELQTLRSAFLSDLVANERKGNVAAQAFILGRIVFIDDEIVSRNGHLSHEKGTPP